MTDLDRKRADQLDVDPFRVELLADGGLAPAAPARARQLSELGPLYRDFYPAMVVGSDPVIYSTSAAPVPEGAGQLGFNLTRIEPGTVGTELHMTHGHVHVRPQGETYLGRTGHGGVLLRRETRVMWLELTPDAVVYIPPGWAHRSVNVGAEPFVFQSVYSMLSGQDYSVVRRHGLGARVFGEPGGAYSVVATGGAVLAAGRSCRR